MDLQTIFGQQDDTLLSIYYASVNECCDMDNYSDSDH